MRLHEFEGKELLQRYGLAVPEGQVVDTPAAAAAAATAMGGQVVLKAQVLAGGRGKAGGIVMTDAASAGPAAARLLGARIHGMAVERLLVERRLPPGREYYLGIALDQAAGGPVVMVSGHGGVNVEAAARRDPRAVARQPVDPLGTLGPAQAAALCATVAGDPGVASALAAALVRLYDLFAAEEALQAEVNPLILAPDGQAVAADAVVELDDAALPRHPGWEPLERMTDDRARRARRLGMTFVDLGPGDVGLVCSGAGLGMTTVDLLMDAAGTAPVRPANFLETGGGITRELMAAALELVLSQPGIRAVLINIYGGINPIHAGAAGVAAVLAEHPGLPVVAKALGNHQEETWAILRQAGVEVVTDVQTESAVRALVRRLQEGAS